MGLGQYSPMEPIHLQNVFFKGICEKANKTNSTGIRTQLMDFFFSEPLTVTLRACPMNQYINISNKLIWHIINRKRLVNSNTSNFYLQGIGLFAAEELYVFIELTFFFDARNNSGFC